MEWDFWRGGGGGVARGHVHVLTRYPRVPAVAAAPPTISSSAHCDLAVALARSCASATASCQEASPCSAAGSGAEGAELSPASEKMREDLVL